jgi:beta-galactosidase
MVAQVERHGRLAAVARRPQFQISLSMSQAHDSPMPSPTTPTPPEPATLPIYYGASWYPELWAETEWDADLARMQSLGFNVVRLFEFAWHRFEPSEGVYDFGWARRLLDACERRGIRVLIGTPTAAPPEWLTRRYPEVLKTKADGSKHWHGKRKHASVHSVRYRDLSAGIVRAMCEKLATHPAVMGWQIDNEISGFDYGPETESHFQRWLAARYGTIEKLNRTWGLEFWSQAYTGFDAVRLVTAEVGSVEVPERHHPSLITAIGRFQNDGIHAFIRLQADIIRKYSRAPISSNMTGFVGATAWEQHFGALDVAGASMYADRRYYSYNLPRFDRLRAEKAGRPYWLLETAPNWSGGGRTFNIHYDARGARLFPWISVMLGGGLVLFWQWREHWAGQEMLHGTCVTASGKWRPNRMVWEQLGREFAAHGPWLAANPPQTARLALVLSSEASWAFAIDPTDENMRYEARMRDDFYGPLQRAQLWRDIISETADLSPYRLVCMPMQPFARKESLDRLKRWVAAGGTLVLGPLSCFRTEEFTVPHPEEFGGFEELIGGRSALRFTAQWVEDQVEVVFDAHGATRTRTLCEAYEPGPDTRVIARYRGGYGDGLPAALEHAYGSGRVITLGCMVDEARWTALVKEACAACGIGPLVQVDPPDARVVAVPRGGDHPGNVVGWALANLEARPVTITLPRGGYDVLAGEPCPAEVPLPSFGVRLVLAAREGGGGSGEG